MSVVRNRGRIKLTYNVSFILTDAISYNITPLYFLTPANFIISEILFSPSQRSLVLSLSFLSRSPCNLSPRNPNPSLGNDPCTQTLQSLKKMESYQRDAMPLNVVWKSTIMKWSQSPNPSQSISSSPRMATHHQQTLLSPQLKKSKGKEIHSSENPNLSPLLGWLTWPDPLSRPRTWVHWSPRVIQKIL